MARTRYKPDQIVRLLRQVEVLHGQDLSMAEAIPRPSHARFVGRLGSAGSG